MEDQFQDCRNVLALTSQVPEAGNVRQVIFMIRKVEASIGDLFNIERAAPTRVGEKTAAT
jgi:hypothetical protein